MRRLLVLFVFLSLLAAACGDDDSSGDAGDPFGSDDDDADDDSSDDDDAEDDDDSDDDDSDDDDADDDSDDSSGDDDADDGGGGGLGFGGNFCDSYATEDLDISGINILSATPEEIEDQFRSNLDKVQDIGASAPDEIKDDVNILIDSVEEVIDALEEVDWNFLALQDDPALDNQEAAAAGERIDAYCGVEDDEPDPAGIPGVDPALVDDLTNIDPDDAEGAALLFYRALGHDEDTARCLVEELGDFTSPDSVTPDDLSAEYCGLTVLQIFSGG